MTKPEIIVEDGTATVVLANGAKFRLYVDHEVGLGVSGFRLKLFAMVGGQDSTMLVMPSSGNAIEVTTPAALQAERAAMQKKVEEREANPDPRPYPISPLHRMPRNGK